MLIYATKRYLIMETFRETEISTNIYNSKNIIKYKFGQDILPLYFGTQTTSEGSPWILKLLLLNDEHCCSRKSGVAGGHSWVLHDLFIGEKTLLMMNDISRTQQPQTTRRQKKKKKKAATYIFCVNKYILVTNPFTHTISAAVGRCRVITMSGRSKNTAATGARAITNRPCTWNKQEIR